MLNEKLWSGRFWLTIITGFVFAYAVYAKLLPSEAIASIVTMVFVSYFQKNDNRNDNRKKEEKL